MLDPYIEVCVYQEIKVEDVEELLLLVIHVK